MKQDNRIPKYWKANLRHYDRQMSLKDRLDLSRISARLKRQFNPVTPIWGLWRGGTKFIEPIVS